MSEEYMPEKDQWVVAQYRDASNLNTRIQLHKRFSTNKMPWSRWVFEHFNTPAGAKVLEIGCGPGKLWVDNRQNLPLDWDVTLSDLSAGMIAQARQALGDGMAGGVPFRYLVCDIQALPFLDDTFDLVIANHMLYHVPDRGRGFSEVRRVLKQGGRFYAATNGENHMRELRELGRRIAPDSGYTANSPALTRFTFEQGERELGAHFDSVTLYRYANSLHVTEVEPLVAYLLSGQTEVVSGKDVERVRRIVAAEMAHKGAIDIRAEPGLLEARIT